MDDIQLQFYRTENSQLYDESQNGRIFVNLNANSHLVCCSQVFCGFNNVVGNNNEYKMANF